MRRVKLGEVCEIISGATPKRERDEYWGGNIPWVTPKELSDLENPYLDDSVEKITESGYKSCSSRMLPAGSLLFSSRAPIGSIAINRIPVCTNQGFKSFIPSESVDVHYLYYCIKKHVPALQARGNGATFKELSKSSVEEFEIPLPPLDDQKRIAHLLGKVDGLIAQRKQHLQQLDALLKSVFLEMFEKAEKWKSISVEAVALPGKGTFVNGPFGSDLLTSELIDEGVPVIYIRDIRNAVYSRVSDVCVSLDKADQLITFQTHPGDVLIAKVGDPPGTSAVYPDGEPIGIVTQDVVRIRPDLSVVNPVFLSEYLNSAWGKRMIREITVEATRARFGLRDLKSQQMPLPPLALQNQFAAIVEKVEHIKTRYQQSLADLEALYGTLSQKAFAGELDLSRVSL